MQAIDDYGDLNGNGMEWRAVAGARGGRGVPAPGGRRPVQVERPRATPPPKKVEEKGGQPSLQHVPCKFFMQGRCTAGNSCPFSHEHPENTAVCKYFLAGTCKYGTSCALAHVSPAGTLLKTKATRNIRNANIRERAEMREQLEQVKQQQDLQDYLFNPEDPIVMGSPRRLGQLAVSPPPDSYLSNGFPLRSSTGSLPRSDPMDLRQPRRRVGSGVIPDDDHGGSPASLLPSSLSDLLTPMEQMQLSRSQEDSYLRSRANGLGFENPAPLSLLSSSASRRLANMQPAGRLSQSYAPGRIVDDPLKMYGRSIPDDILSAPSTRLPYSPSEADMYRYAREDIGPPGLSSAGVIGNPLPQSRSLLSSAFGASMLNDEMGRPPLAARPTGMSAAESPAPSLGRGTSPGELNGSTSWNPMAADDIDVFRMDSIDQELPVSEDVEYRIQESLPPISGLAAVSASSSSAASPLSFSAAARKAINTGDVVSENRPSPAMQEAAKMTKSVPVDPRRNAPLCPFAVAGTCKMGDRCRYVHGLPCPSCHRAVLHPGESAAEHQLHVVECQRLIAASDDAKTQLEAGKNLECGICFEKVMTKKDPRFGLLICEHPFCIECIRGWRNAHAQDESKSCPLCRVFTPFITPSAIWLSDAEKMDAIEKYKQALGRIPCKWWNYGQGTCPFGTSCLYLHTDRAGNVVKPELRSAQTSDGTGVVLSAVKLSDFLFPQ